MLPRYADVRCALMNAAVLSNRTGRGGTRTNPTIDAILDAQGFRPVDALISNDAPEHRYYRRLVERAFTTAKVERMEPRIQQIVDALIDACEGQPEAEVLAAFAIRLPMIVIAEQLAFPPGHMGRFKLVRHLGREHGSHHDASAKSPLSTNSPRCSAVSPPRSSGCAQRPTITLLSHLVHVDIDGERLEMPPLQNILQRLLVAGNETITMTLAAGLKLLIDDPALVPILLAESAHIRAFVEATLRLMSPVQTLFRRVKQEINIAGVCVPANAMLEVRFGAGNRDPAAYSCPSSVDLDRAGAPSRLAFGAGPHLCIGNQLARAELSSASASRNTRDISSCNTNPP